MKIKTFRPSELARVTQKTIASVALILAIAVFMSNVKNTGSFNEVSKFLYSKILPR